jgi:hypothetical protein
MIFGFNFDFELNEGLNVIILNSHFEQVIYDYRMIYRVKINDNIIKILK